MGAEINGGHFDLGSLMTSTLLETGGQLLSAIRSAHWIELKAPFLNLTKSPFTTDVIFFPLGIGLKKVPLMSVEKSGLVLVICTNEA